MQTQNGKHTTDMHVMVYLVKECSCIGYHKVLLAMMFKAFEAKLLHAHEHASQCTIHVFDPDG